LGTQPKTEKLRIAYIGKNPWILNEPDLNFFNSYEVKLIGCVIYMYNDMLNYVEKVFEENEAQYSTNVKLFPFRNRIDHINRVFIWAKRLLQNEKANEQLVLTAAVFHDVGYAISENAKEHSYNSSIICERYLKEKNFDKEFIDKVTYLILNHSYKKLMNKSDTEMELILLMEADLLDETGALSIVWDCMMEGSETEQSFEKSYKHIKEYSYEIINENPMVSNTAKYYWEEKQELVKKFVDSLAFDLGLDRK